MQVGGVQVIHHVMWRSQEGSRLSGLRIDLSPGHVLVVIVRPCRQHREPSADMLARVLRALHRSTSGLEPNRMEQNSTERSRGEAM